MVETTYSFTLTNAKTIERILEDDNVGINHIVLSKGDALPEHYSNSHVYLIVARGTITLQLNEQEAHSYASGNIVTIPFKTKMNVSNTNDEILEFFIVKAPSPKVMVNK